MVTLDDVDEDTTEVFFTVDDEVEEATEPA